MNAAIQLNSTSHTNIYRNLEFTEMMRILRYPGTISIESFHTPNFELAADILYWMAQRYDPSIPIHNSIDSESDRVQFITGIVKNFYEKGNIRLNAKRLYASDGHAVKELIKVASALMYAVQVENKHRMSKSEQQSEGSISVCMDDVKALRAIATKVTESGARLHSLLAKEMGAEKGREEVSNFLDAANASFGQSQELERIETTLLAQLDQRKHELSALQEEFAHVEADKKDVVADVKKKKDDLDRNMRRLESLQTTRPAFMDEFESLEIELQKHYELYMERYRNIHYLKHELQVVERDEEEKLKEANRNMKRLQSKLREEEFKILKGDDESFEEENIVSSDDSSASSGSSSRDEPQDPSLHDDEPPHETDAIVLEDDSSVDRSSALMVSHSTNGSNDSSKVSFSVDSATYFMDSGENSQLSPNSKTSSEDSDDNF